MTSRYRSHAPFGIGAEQLLGVGELGPSPPTEQAVDREISLNVVNKEQYRKVSDWFDAHAHQKILFLELGVELRNGVIKRMLAQIANACEHITYTAFNYSQAMAPDTSCETILVDGEMTPGIITLPFWSMTAKLPDAHLLSVNITGDSAPLQLGNKAEAIQADLSTLLSAARKGDEQRGEV